MVSKNKRLLQRFRVPLGFLFAAVFLVFAKPQPITIFAGGFIAGFGLLIRAWASGHIRKNQDLAVSGPYAYSRNPLYLGSFIMGLGCSIASGVWWLALLFIILFLGIYLPVMRVESEDLTQIFGEDYEEYAGRVPMFFPRRPVQRSSGLKFDINLYLRYREYRAALGVAFVLAVLVIKSYFLQ